MRSKQGRKRGPGVENAVTGILLLGLAILLLGIGQLLTLRGLREISRIQKAIAGLIVQEFEKIQTLSKRS